MQPRPTPMPPVPDRAPYLRVRVDGDDLVLKVPSLYLVGQVIRALEVEKHFGSLAALAASTDTIARLVAMMRSGPELCELAGAMLGCAWADPIRELDAERPKVWTDGSARAFGGAVYEELHEAGWTTAHIAKAAILVGRQIWEAANIEKEVHEMADFFGLPKGTKPEETPPSTLSGQASQSEVGSLH